MDFAWEFDVFFEHVLVRKWSQNESKQGCKIDPKMMRNRCPRQDAVLGRFWVDFGSIWGRFWDDFGMILGRFWDDLGFILGLFLKGFWRPFVAASAANYMTSLRMHTSQLQQKNSQLSKNMRFPSPQPCWPGLTRHWASFLAVFSSYFRRFFGCVFWLISWRFREPFWTHFRLKVRSKRLQKSVKK